MQSWQRDVVQVGVVLAAGGLVVLGSTGGDTAPLWASLDVANPAQREPALTLLGLALVVGLRVATRLDRSLG